MNIYIYGKSIILQKSNDTPHCRICGATDDLIESADAALKYHICEKCKEKINELE